MAKKIIIPDDEDQELKDKAFFDQYLDSSWVDQAWLGLGNVNHIKLNNPILHRTEEDIENPGLHFLRTMRKPSYLAFAAKTLLGINLLPIQAVILEELWKRPFPMLIASRGAGKTFLLGVYSLLKCVLSTNTKIIIAGAAFRQSKFVFEYAESIWNNSSILRSICDNHSGPRRENDRCTLHINENQIIAIPIADGSKIRGLRAKIVIAEEFASHSPDVYETVIAGFAAVSADPVINVKEFARKEAMQNLGLWTNSLEEEYINKDTNQAIISGTAYYSFNHFYDYWLRYKRIIESKGDPKKLANALGSSEVPPGFNWRDYSIIRIPYELIPKGFMDEKIVARAKATVHSGSYMCEYSACVLPDTEIITDCGLKKITDINIGDMVLTHKGRFKKVIKKTYRDFDSKVLSILNYGYGNIIKITPNHPLWIDNDWVLSENLTNYTNLVNLKELNNKSSLELSKYCSDFNSVCINDKKFLYAKGNRVRISQEDIKYILESKETNKEISKKFGICYDYVSLLRNGKRGNIKVKGCIPSEIPLNYDFGLIVGYYASEGSCGANGRACCFALDGHVNTKLQFFVKQLSDAIKNVFDLEPKIYKKVDNVCDVVLNNRLIVDLMKYICPGVSHTKYIKPEILFSNKDFLKGFITGYWNGDGHLKEDRNFAVAGCVNKGLLSQVRTALSFFGISSSLNYRKKMMNAFFKNRNKSYKTKQVYLLTIFGESLRKFKKDFYNIIDNGKNGRSRNIINDNEKSIFNIKKKEYVDYKGYVYNLEVEDDESYSLPNMTVHNCFSLDSDGFFKQSLIQSCVTSEAKPIQLSKSGNILFDASLRGDPNKRYVYGVDPASERDNFSVVILELNEDHTRVVYCWTTNRQNFKKKLSLGMTSEHDFYKYTARKIRDLMTVFPCERIAMDSQGGGVAVSEALQDPGNLKLGEKPILPIVDPEKEKDTDHKPGLHILELCNFAKYEWVRDANHGLRKDLEDKVLLFPRFDSISLGLAADRDADVRDGIKRSGGKGIDYIDSFEDCIMDIEELKNEMATITVTVTGTGINARERWDVPEVKLPGGKKGRMRKDRYSALLMANMVARQIARADIPIQYKVIGGFARDLAVGKKRGEKENQLYFGPSWLQADSWGKGFGLVSKR